MEYEVETNNKEGKQVQNQIENTNVSNVIHVDDIEDTLPVFISVDEVLYDEVN